MWTVPVKVVLRRLCATALFFALNVHATTLLYRNIDNLVDEAEGIVIGTVTKTVSTYGRENVIYTFVNIEDIEAIKGRVVGRNLVLRFEGGRMSGEIYELAGAPKFQTGDKVMLFIHGNGRYSIPLVGWTQGVFRIVNDPLSGKQTVSDHEGNKLLGISGNRLAKEYRIQSEAHIVGSDEESRASAPARSGSGISVKGIASVQPGQNVAQQGSALTLERFLNEIKPRVGKAAMLNPASSTQVLESASIPDPIRLQRELSPYDGERSKKLPPALGDEPQLPALFPTAPYDKP